MRARHRVPIVLGRPDDRAGHDPLGAGLSVRGGVLSRYRTPTALVIRHLPDGRGGERHVQYKLRRGRMGRGEVGAVPDRVLIATDLSTAAEAVLRTGLTLAKRLAAETLVLHIFNDAEYQEQRLAVPTITIDVYAGNLAMRLRHLIASLEVPHEHVRVEVIPGDDAVVADQILEAAHQMKANLIVLGTHGRTGLPRVLMGSVAEAVVRHSDAPVLVVPTRAPVFQGAPAFP